MLLLCQCLIDFSLCCYSEKRLCVVVTLFWKGQTLSHTHTVPLLFFVFISFSHYCRAVINRGEPINTRGYLGNQVCGTEVWRRSGREEARSRSVDCICSSCCSCSSAWHVTGEVLWIKECHARTNLLVSVKTQLVYQNSLVLNMMQQIGHALYVMSPLDAAHISPLLFSFCAEANVFVWCQSNTDQSDRLTAALPPCCFHVLPKQTLRSHVYFLQSQLEQRMCLWGQLQLYLDPHPPKEPNSHRASRFPMMLTTKHFPLASFECSSDTSARTEINISRVTTLGCWCGFTVYLYTLKSTCWSNNFYNVWGAFYALQPRKHLTRSSLSSFGVRRK